MSASYKDVLRASLHGRFDEAKELGSQLEGVTWENSGLLLGAALFLAANKRFADDSSRDAVAEFIKQCGDAIESEGIEFRPLVWEGLVRGVLGEEELLQSIPPEEAMPAQMGLVYVMLQDLDMHGAQIDGFVDESETLAAQWAAE